MNKDLTENIKETLDSSIIAYHGSSQNFDNFNQKINWFSTDREYALKYANASQNGVLYTVKLQLDNVFDCGQTDGRVYEILPVIKPYKFSQRFSEIISSIGLTEEEARNLVNDIAEKRSEEYNIKIFSVTNHKDFADIALSRGYDAIRTVEFGSECYGVFSDDNIEIIEKQNSKSFDAMEEKLSPDGYGQNNKKIIAYHGSQNSNMSLEDRPMYLTDSKEQATEFAKGYMFNYELYDGEIPTVYKMEVDIKNPKYITDEDEYEDIMVDARMSVENLTSDGYDGMIYNDGYQTYYAVISAKHQCRIIDKEDVSGKLYEREESYEDSDLNESLLENDEDYHTGEASGKDIFADRTGVSFYDSIYKNKEEAQRKNLKAEVVMMSPNEYYEECSRYAYGHYVSVDNLKQQRRYDKKVLDDLKDTVENHNRKLFMPYINRAEGGQEGLHRMMYAGDRFGWDEKFPVLCIDWIDEEKHREDVKKEEEQKIKSKLYRAIQEASVYNYSDINEFKEQMSYEIDRVFYEPTEFELNVNNEDISISVDNVSVKIPKEDLNIKSFDVKDDDIDMDIDLDDLSIDDLELL